MTTTEQNKPTPRFSLIIPAYNEAERLPALLASVEVARNRYHGGELMIEVIVANNCSTDATAQIAHDAGAVVVNVEKRIIAAARNGGTAIATGEIICFIDADSRIHADTFNAIDDTLAKGNVVCGATGITPDRWSLGIRATWLVAIVTTFFMRIDAGVVFCRRADYDAVGGYNEDREYAEDVQFLVDLKRLGKARGQYFARTVNAEAITSTRKFDHFGDWHYFTKMPRVLFWMFINKTRVQAFTRRYWYEDR
jgi:glycosyltransferase involved in cell wall biosynthesis